MDPDANIAEQERIIERQDPDSITGRERTSAQVADDRARLRELRAALAEWRGAQPRRRQ